MCRVCINEHRLIFDASSLRDAAHQSASRQSSSEYTGTYLSGSKSPSCMVPSGRSPNVSDDLLGLFWLLLHCRSHRSSCAVTMSSTLSSSIARFCLTGLDGKHCKHVAQLLGQLQHSTFDSDYFLL